MKRFAAPTIILAICLSLSGCVATIPSLPNEADLRWEVVTAGFWDEVARVAELSGSDEPAPAVHWLRDKRTTITYSGGRFTTFQVFRTKTAILDADRAQEYANIAIPTSAGRPVSRLRARTLLRNGSDLDVLDENIHEQNRFPGYSLYTDLKEKVFAMPGFQDSCVIEMEYTITSTGPYLEDHFVVSDFIPVRRSYYSFGIPAMVVDAGYNIATRTPGHAMQPRSHHHSLPDGQVSTLIWEREDVPAISDEEFMPPYRDLAARVSIAFDRSPDIDHYRWPMLGDDYYDEEIAPMLDAAALAAVRDEAREWTDGCGSDAERLEAICGNIVKRTRYVAVGLEGMGWTPRPAQEVLRTKYGDCKDMTMLAVTLLRSMSIEADPAILMTRNIGMLDTTLVTPSSMNHMILTAEIAGEREWIDLTAGSFQLGSLPSADRGATALVLREDGAVFESVPTVPENENQVVRTLTVELDEEGTARGRLLESRSGDLALSRHSMVRSTGRQEMKELLVQTMQRSYPHAIVLDWSYGSELSPDESKLSLEFEAEGCAIRSGDRMVLNGHLLSTAGLGRPLQQRDRRNNVMIRQPICITQDATVELPDGWVVESMPSPQEHVCVFGRYNRELSCDGAVIHCTSTFEMYERRLPADRYEELRSFINGVEQWNSEPVIIVRR